MFRIFYAITSLSFLGLGLLLVEYQAPFWVAVPAAYFLYIIVSIVIARSHRKKISRLFIAEESIQEKTNLTSKEIQDLHVKIEASSIFVERLALLEEFHLELVGILDETRMSKVFLEKLKNIYKNADYFLLYLVDFREQSLKLKYSLRGGRGSFKAVQLDSIDRLILHRNQPLLVEDARKDYRFSYKAEDLRFISCICSPLSLGKRILGLVRIESRKPNLFTFEDLRFLQGTSGAFALFLDNLHLYKRTEELAIKDDLTGFYLRNYATRRFEEEIARAKKQSRILSVMIVDIDHFKKCNDTYGHLVGDMVLENVADVIKEVIGNAGNVICRFGGEEFLIILPNLSRQEAISVGESLRLRVENTPLKVRRREISVTVSVGLAFFPQDADSPQELIKKADGRLYVAKNTGRNRVCY